MFILHQGFVRPYGSVLYCLSVCLTANLCLLMWQNHGSVIRALSRGPMLWTSASHAGFTMASSPWLPVHPSYHTANVEVLCTLCHLLIPRVSNYCLREWQQIWSNCVNNKLYAIYQTVGSVVHNKGLSRHESVIINRLRIGHTRLTHSYLLSSDDQPTCSTCGHPLTVRHILLDCVDLQDVRRRHFSVTCLRDLFETVDNRIVIDFIKEIRFYSLL